DQFLQIQAQVTDLNPHINHIQTHKTLPQLTHQYYTLKNTLNHIPNHSSTLTYIQPLLQQHINQINHNPLPQLINQPLSIFKNL
ncbi:hypothetical protein, partial [Staphylococcus epidermidis]|uniref:hypothetical protein n=1 Tax=Staphylococcus epidermidis TaxID=1282 RepID=UPI001C9319C8